MVKRFSFADGFKIVAIRDNGKIMNSKQVCNKLNELHEENANLNTKISNLESDLDYFRAKCGSLEEGLFQKDMEIAELQEEYKKLKLQNEELLYQIGWVGKNNQTCRECECFLPDIKYCYMWDMEVEADDVVVACDQRKVKNNGDDKK